jgi:hypothetical protein
MSCTACDSGLGVAGTTGGGRRRKMCKKCQRGGALPSLNPVSLSNSDSFDKSGNSLANTAHNLYVKQNYDLAALKNINPMMGGRKKKRSKTAKKYRSKSKSKQQRGGILELGAFINEAAVPVTLLAAQQKFKGRRTKGYMGKSRRFRGSRRSRRR